jgi:hypothetical protein
MQPLAPAGGSGSEVNANLSTSISLSVLDQYGNDIPIHASIDHPIEFIIPRDANLILPSMVLQNVTSITNDNNLVFNPHFVNITQSNCNLTLSLHFEMRPVNTSLAYLLIYKFDNFPQLSISINQIDGRSLLCPSSEFFFFFLRNNIFYKSI